LPAFKTVKNVRGSVSKVMHRVPDIYILDIYIRWYGWSSKFQNLKPDKPYPVYLTLEKSKKPVSAGCAA